MKVEDPFPDEDRALALACVVGSLPDRHYACEVFENKFRDLLVQDLRTKFPDIPPASAIELARDLLSECTMGSPKKPEPSLKKYHGKCPLTAWLRTCIRHKAVDWLRYPGNRLAEPPDDREKNSPTTPPVRRPESALLELLRQALLDGLANCPFESRLMLRLVHVEGLTQREVARMRSWHEAKVSKHLAEAMTDIRNATMEAVKRQDPWMQIEWEDFLEMCEASKSPLPL